MFIFLWLIKFVLIFIANLLQAHQPPATLFFSCFLIFLHLFWILQFVSSLNCFSFCCGVFCPLVKFILFPLCILHMFLLFLPLSFSILNKYITISVGFTVFTLLHTESKFSFRLRFSVHADNIPILFLNSLTPPLSTLNSIVFSPPPFSFLFLSCPSSSPLSQEETGRKYVMTPP